MIAKFEVIRKDKLLIWVKVYPLLDILFTKELLCIAFGAIKAVGTFPVAFRHLNQLGFKTPIVINFVTNRANQ